MVLWGVTLQSFKNVFVLALVIFVTDNWILAALIFLEPLYIYAVIFLRLVFQLGFWTRNIFSDPAAVSLHTISIPTVERLYYYFIAIRHNQRARLPAEYQCCSLSGLGWTWKPAMELTAADGRSHIAFQMPSWHTSHAISPPCTRSVDKRKNNYW